MNLAVSPWRVAPQDSVHLEVDENESCGVALESRTARFQPIWKSMRINFALPPSRATPCPQKYSPPHVNPTHPCFRVRHQTPWIVLAILRFSADQVLAAR